MTKPKFTPWFPIDVKPVRPGVYQTRLRLLNGKLSETWFSYWDGKRWSDSGPTITTAELRRRCEGLQDKKWRGLAEEPK